MRARLGLSLVQGVGLAVTIAAHVPWAILESSGTITVVPMSSVATTTATRHATEAGPDT